MLLALQNASSVERLCFLKPTLLYTGWDGASAFLNGDRIMLERYTLNRTHVAALRALAERIVEASPLEVAVSAQLLPNQAATALAQLEQIKLATSWVPVTGRTGEHLYVPTSEGQIVYRALSQFKGDVPVGTVVRLSRSLPTFLEWMSKETPSDVEIVAD